LPDMGDVFTAIDLVVATLIRHSFEIFALLQGPGGNGKSVYERVIQALLPRDRVTAVSFDEIKGSRFGAGNLLNKDLWLVSEVAHAKDVVNLAKRVATGDYIDSDVKYGGRATGNPHALLMMDANNAIEFGDNSRGVMRRLVKLDFPYTFGYGPKDRPKDPQWGEFLTRPEHLAGVLWLALLRGPSLWKSKEIYRRKSEDQTREEHARQRYHLEYFCNECLSTYPPEFGQAGSVTVDQAYNEYLEYCRLFSVPVPANQIRFGRYIKDRFGVVSSVAKIDGKSQRVYQGVYLVTTAKTAHADFLVNFSAPSTDSGYRFYRSVTDWLQIDASTDSEVTDSTDFLVIEEIKRMLGYIEERVKAGNFADIKFERFAEKSVESVTTDSGRPCDNLAICNQSVTDSGRHQGDIKPPGEGLREEESGGAGAGGAGPGGAPGGAGCGGGGGAEMSEGAGGDRRGGDAVESGGAPGESSHSTEPRSVDALRLKPQEKEAEKEVATTPSTEPGSVNALISELHRRGELSIRDMLLVKELQRGGSVGRAVFDVNTNLGWTLPETMRRLERLRALGVAEETVDALGTRRWRLRA
ncbi:DUF5906 domain-containing protein, partial [Methanothrix sp.]|uniref:DUF5906 domain-containing protein n=1 Tax=Methanothrix sp. TaxID=90426 RepID=UPI0034E289E1